MCLGPCMQRADCRGHAVQPFTEFRAVIEGAGCPNTVRRVSRACPGQGAGSRADAGPCPRDAAPLHRDRSHAVHGSSVSADADRVAGGDRSAQRGRVVAGAVAASRAEAELGADRQRSARASSSHAGATPRRVRRPSRAVATSRGGAQRPVESYTRTRSNAVRARRRLAMLASWMVRMSRSEAPCPPPCARRSARPESGLHRE